MAVDQNTVSFRNEKITHTLFSIANAVNTTSNLDDLYICIYNSLNKLIKLPNFFIAIVDREKKLLSFPFFVDENDTRESIKTGLEKYETSTSNTSQVILKRKPLFLRQEVLSEKYKQNKTIGTVSVIWLGVPLIVRNEVIGVMVLQHYSDPDYFTKNDMDLLIAVSDQVALAIDRKKSLEKIKLNEKITRTLFSISNAVNTADKLENLYQSIYDSLNMLISLPNFFICLLDKNQKVMHFPFYQDEYDSDETIAFTVNYCETNNYISTDVIKSKKPILLTQDILEKRRIKGTILGAVPKIWLGVPLIVRNKVIGVMAAQHYHDPDYFSQREMELFIAVSDQVAIAIDRRQFQEDLKEAKIKTDQANKELNNEINERKHSENINKTLFAISNAVNMTLNLYDLYQQIHNYLGRIIDVTNFFIAIVDRKEQTLNFPYHVDTQDDDFSPITNFNPDESLSGLVVTQRKPVMLNKTQLKKITAQKRALGPVSLIWLGVPLVIRNEVIGLISVQSYTDPHLYTHQDLQILSSVSDQVAIAIDRKLTEEGLRASEKRYRHLFDNAPTAMYEIDFLKENFTNVNKTMCTSFGYTKEEFLSMTPLNLFTDQSKKLFKKGYKNLLKGNHKSDNIEYTIKRRDGQERSVILNYDFISKNSEIIGAQVVVHDITERKKIEAMMIQSEKMLSVGGLAAGMAHEINNPLAGIMQNAQVVLNRLTKTLPANEEEALKAGTTMAAINKYIERRKICQLLENIHKAGSNAATIVNNMLSFAKKGNASKTNCSLPELVNKTIELAQSDYDLKKKYDFREIKIINEFDPLTPEVLCEESKLLQVLFNIIKNAAEAMYGEGQKKVLPQLIFRIFKAGDLARLEIEDNGPGMDETTRKRIFEPFFTTKDVSRGTGLGLSLSYFIIVDDHNGALEAESTLGKGTKFIITLPVA